MHETKRRESNHIIQKPKIEIIYENENEFTGSKTSIDPRLHHALPSPDPTDIIFTLNGDGHINHGYQGSTQTIHQVHGSTPSMQVTREQYWSCTLPRIHCNNWTKREKILFVILICLSLVIIGLVIVLSWNLERSESTKNDWFPWKL